MQICFKHHERFFASVGKYVLSNFNMPAVLTEIFKLSCACVFHVGDMPIFFAQVHPTGFGLTSARMTKLLQ